jgi:hypothetical protein
MKSINVLVLFAFSSNESGKKPTCKPLMEPYMGDGPLLVPMLKALLSEGIIFTPSKDISTISIPFTRAALKALI